MQSQSPLFLVISGFLGSGKTTFLRRLIESNLLPQPLLVIINDFGDEVLDNIYFVGDEQSLKEMPAGCICCSSTDEFRAVLSGIRENMPATVIIEATGIADVAALRREIRIGGFIPDTVFCVIDPIAYYKLAHKIPSLNAQIRDADVLLISQTDRLPPDEIQKFTKHLEQIHRKAPRLLLRHGKAESEALLPFLVPEHLLIPEDEHQPPLPFQETHVHFHALIASWGGVLSESDLRQLLDDLPSDVIRLKLRAAARRETGETSIAFFHKTVASAHLAYLPVDASLAPPEGGKLVCLVENDHIATKVVSILTNNRRLIDNGILVSKGQPHKH